MALASVKQSRRAVVPEIRMPLTLEHALDEPPASLRLMLVEPGACAGVEHVFERCRRFRRRPTPRCCRARRRMDGGGVRRPRATRGVRLVTLGHRTLRADAVPVAAISVLQFFWGDLLRVARVRIQESDSVQSGI